MGSIKDLPGAGNSFRVSHVAGNFTKKFSRAVKYGSSLRNLADNKEAIIKVVKKNEGIIRIGKFDRLRRLRAWREIKKMEGNNLSKDDKREIKLVLKHLGARKSSDVSAEEKINRDEIAKDKIEIEKEKISAPKIRIARDENGNINFNSIRNASRSSSSGAPLSRSASRAAAARASINYERMSRITGASGRDLQKDAYAKLSALDPSKAAEMAKERNIRTNRSLDINSGPGMGSSHSGGSNIKLAV